MRVRSLEDALAVAHKAIANDRHPLLSDELLRIKNPLERDVNAEPVRMSEEEDTIEGMKRLIVDEVQSFRAEVRQQARAGGQIRRQDRCV